MDIDAYRLAEDVRLEMWMMDVREKEGLKE
jgi:hypothetical protein